MPRLDLPIEQLREYRPEVAEPADFDAFWATTLTEARAFDTEVVLTAVDAALSLVDVYDLTFPGFGGDPVRAWFMVPVGGTGALPTVVEYLGYGGGRGFPHENLSWVAAGYAYLLMDTRGQGSGWGSGGETPDPHGSGAASPGFTTRGIDDPLDYYYRRVYTDAVRAIDAVRTLDRVDPDRIAVTGRSQGGGIALAVAGLVPDLVAAMPDVPFLSHFAHAVGFGGSGGPYQELLGYLSVHRDSTERVFTTLSYFDGVNFAKRASVPAVFSVGLMDPICPPSTVFAAFNAYRGESSIEVYPYNEHEGGAGYHWLAQASWLAERLEP